MLNEMDLCIDVFFSQVETIEEKIELGNIEEVIELAKDELTLVDFYYGALLNCGCHCCGFSSLLWCFRL
jgi:hypothetical protein